MNEIGKKTRIRFHVAYDGTDYCGWQKQAPTRPKQSLCQEIESALCKIFNEEIHLFASGRTDAGVHAFNQVCHFDTSWPEDRIKKWDFCWGLQSNVSSNIIIKKAWIAPSEFHATLSPTHKTYRYIILNRDRQSPFLRKFADWIRRPLDIEHLNASSKFLIGEHDFKSFQSVGSVVPHTKREIFSSHWVWKRPGILMYTVTGSGFLKQMVRNIVGTSLMLERKKCDPEKMKSILAALDRKQAGPPAPPQGLFLFKVYYPKELDKRCLEI